jgi:hypothetical protein
VKNGVTGDEFGFLFSQGQGDRLLAQDAYGARWLGIVETTAPEQGILWIRTDIGERKLLDIQEHKIRAAPSAGLRQAST